MPTLRLTAKEGVDYDVELTDEQLAAYNAGKNSNRVRVDVDVETQTFRISSQSGSGDLDTLASGPAKPAQGS
jgi:hypothetical protein